MGVVRKDRFPLFSGSARTEVIHESVAALATAEAIMPCRGHLLAIPLTETDFCTACRHSLPKRATECFAFDAKLAMVLCAILLSACGVLGTSDVKFQPERSGTSRDSETRSEFIQRLRNALRKTVLGARRSISHTKKTIPDINPISQVQ